MSSFTRVGRDGDVKRITGVLLFSAVVVTAWLASPDLPSPTRLLAVFLITFFPAAMLVQGRTAWEIPAGTTRVSIYLSSSLGLWLLAAITVAAVLASRYSLDLLGVRALPVGELLGWTLGILVIGVAWVAIGSYLPVRETPLLRFMLPRTSMEKGAFVGVALTAGICEELVFRGFLIPALDAMLGSMTAAVILSSLVFGLTHAYQGFFGILRTGTLGLLLALPVVATGSVLPSMLAHFLINIVAGILLAEWLLRRRHAGGDPVRP
jgi:uncharacterized protein